MRTDRAERSTASFKRCGALRYDTALMTDAPDTLTDRVHLKTTPLLDFEHPTITKLVRDSSWMELPPEERIGTVYTHVRDGIPFGYNTVDDLPASRVLSDGYGQCNTKTTLLMALLRAVGVPCRFHGATIQKELQKGVVNGMFYRLAPSEIVHTWAEVQVDGKWTSLEGVILDGPYLDGLRRRFPDEDGPFLGYGVGTDNLADPPIDWQGDDTAIQATGLARDHGVFPDPDGFYSSVGANLPGPRGWLFRHVVRHRMNRNVAGIRSRATGQAG